MSTDIICEYKDSEIICLFHLIIETFNLKGFYGLKCELEINECLSQPCTHGQCINLVNGYACINCSLVGFTGPACDIPIDYCSSSPCIQNQVRYYLSKIL